MSLNSLNKVQIIGALGRDPESRSLQNGGKMVNLTIATSEQWKDKASGEKKERTEWHKVTIWNPALADLAERFLKKGNRVYIEGQLETRKWQDKDGNDRYSTEVVLRPFTGSLVFLERRSSDGGGRDGGERRADPAQRQADRTNPSGDPQWDAPRGGSTGGDLDDEIPFGPECR